MLLKYLSLVPLISCNSNTLPDPDIQGSSGKEMIGNLLNRDEESNKIMTDVLTAIYIIQI